MNYLGHNTGAAFLFLNARRAWDARHDAKAFLTAAPKPKTWHVYAGGHGPTPAAREYLRAKIRQNLRASGLPREQAVAHGIAAVQWVEGAYVTTKVASDDVEVVTWARNEDVAKSPHEAKKSHCRRPFGQRSRGKRPLYWTAEPAR